MDYDNDLDDELGYEGVYEGGFDPGEPSYPFPGDGIRTVVVDGHTVMVYSWAKWVAQDLSGAWWQYSGEPALAAAESSWDVGDTDDSCLPLIMGVRNEGWMDTKRFIGEKEEGVTEGE